MISIFGFWKIFHSVVRLIWIVGLLPSSIVWGVLLFLASL